MTDLLSGIPVNFCSGPNFSALQGSLLDKDENCQTSLRTGPLRRSEAMPSVKVLIKPQSARQVLESVIIAFVSAIILSCSIILRWRAACRVVKCTQGFYIHKEKHVPLSRPGSTNLASR